MVKFSKYLSFNSLNFNNLSLKRILTNNLSRLKKPTAKNLKSASLCDNIVESAKKKDQQKKLKRWQKRTRELKETQVTGNNNINTIKKK